MRFITRWWREFMKVRSLDAEQARREYLTRRALAMVTVVVGAFLIFFLVGWRLGIYHFVNVQILLVVNLVTAATDWLAYRNRWRLASYLLPALFIGLAALLTYRNSMWSPAVIFYAPAVLLAAELLGQREQWVALGLSLVTFAAAGWLNGTSPADQFVSILISIAAPMLGVALMRWLADRLLRRAQRNERAALERLQAANASLQAEVAERRRAEAALAESEARHRAVLKALPAGLFVVQVEPDGRLVFAGANPAAREICGGDPTSLIGKTLDEAFPHLVQAGIVPLIRRAAATGEGADVALTPYQRGDEVRLYESRIFRSAPNQVVGVVVDITERERALNELRLLQAAVEQIDEAVVVTSAEGIARYFNPAFERITGFGEPDLGTFSFDGAVIPLETLAPIRETLDAGQSWSGRITAWGKDNAFSFPAALTASPIRDAEGRITHYAFVGRDISEQIALEEQLRQAQKMEAVGQLAGGVAHDFNNLLQVIQGYTELAHQDAFNPNVARADLDEVMTAAQRATSLVRQLLAFSRREMVNPAYLNLNEVTAGLIKMLRRLIGEHIALETDFCGDSAPIYADAGQIEQVIINLCVNARDAIPVSDGGRIILRTGRAVLTPAFAAERLWARAGDFVTLSVQDTGVGMTPEVMEHMFEPFYTTKGPGKGTGLGLPMVYGVVKQHEGLIEVQSAVGQGTTFTLYLPQAEPPPPAAQGGAGAADGAPTPPQGRGEGILIAEDEALVRRLAENLLTRAGYRVLAARDGEEALRLYAEHAAEVRLALLDVVMPGMSGRVVAEQLRAQSPGLPILFSSGYDFQLLEQALPSGERANLVHKPYNPTELLRRVREALGG